MQRRGTGTPPKSVVFRGQHRFRLENGERLILVAQRHWVALLLRAFIPASVALVCVAVFLLRGLNSQADILGRPPPLFDALNIFLFISVLITVLILAYIYSDWRNDYLFVTNKRVVREDTTLGIATDDAAIPLDKVQNVIVRKENIFQYALKYAYLEVEAAGATAPIVFDRVRQPDAVRESIMGEVNRQKKTQEQKRLEEAFDQRFNPKPLPPPARPVQRSLLEQILPITPIEDPTNRSIMWHRHWVVLLKQLLRPFVALIIWLLLLWALPQLELLSTAATTILLFITFLAIMFYFYWEYEDWRNDVYILEPNRLIDISRLPFGLFEDRREARLGVIQNVNSESPNIIARLFNYGNVLIETAGLSGNFTFNNVPDPDEVQRKVFDYLDDFQWRQKERDWNAAADIYEMYEQARRRRQPPPP